MQLSKVFIASSRQSMVATYSPMVAATVFAFSWNHHLEMNQRILTSLIGGVLFGLLPAVLFRAFYVLSGKWKDD